MFDFFGCSFPSDELVSLLTQIIMVKYVFSYTYHEESTNTCILFIEDFIKNFSNIKTENGYLTTILGFLQIYLPCYPDKIYNK